MSENLFKASPVWHKINGKLLQDPSGVDFTTFREVGMGRANIKITTWNPYEPSTRYFKTLLSHIVYQASDEFLNTYGNLTNTGLGNPINIRRSGIEFNLDYILSTYEVLFIKPFDQKTVCEIGAGFGRTAHAMLECYPNIEKYTIIDLPNCLTLTQGYLKKVLSQKLYDKLEFLRADELDSSAFKPIDLFINIDSFAEMTKPTIQNYLKLIQDYGKYFYSKNTIGKYKPSDMGLINTNSDDIDNIMETGLCSHQIDVFDDRALHVGLAEYKEAYRPQGAVVLKSQLAPPFYYYGDVLYNLRKR